MDEKAATRRRRTDAERNLGALLEAAGEVFDRSGVDAPARQIAEAAGVGVGTLYRHFPRRSELILAVLQQEIDACAEAVADLRSRYDPAEALECWVDRYVDLVATKRGFAEALHSENEALAGVHAAVMASLEPAVAELIKDGEAAGELRDDLGARELLYAVALLCHPLPGGDVKINRKMIKIFLNGVKR